MAASNSIMQELHEALAGQLLDMIKNGIPVDGKPDDDGNVEQTFRRPTAAELGVAVSFLKNNSVTMSVEEDDALKELQQALAKRKSKPVMPDALDMGGFH